MKKLSIAILASLLGVLFMGAAAVSTSTVLVETSSRALTGNLVVGSGKTLTTAGTGTITANALASSVTGSPTISGNLTVSGTGTHSFAGDLRVNASGPDLFLNNTGAGGAMWNVGVIDTTGLFQVAESGVGQWFTIAKTTGAASFNGTGTHSFAGPVYVNRTGSNGTVIQGLALRHNQNGVGTGVALDFIPESTDNALVRIVGTRTDLSNGYADVDIQSWNGSANVSRLKITGGATGAGGVQINGTSAIKGVRTATDTFNFGSLAAGASEVITKSVSGVVAGQCSVIVGTNEGSDVSDALEIRAWVSASDTVSVKAINRSGSTFDPPAYDLRVTVISF